MAVLNRLKRWLGSLDLSRPRRAVPSGPAAYDVWPDLFDGRAYRPHSVWATDIASGPLGGYRSISQRPFDGQCWGRCASPETTWTADRNGNPVPPQKGCDGC